jgi:hypothetical protein
LIVAEEMNMQSMTPRRKNEGKQSFDIQRKNWKNIIILSNQRYQILNNDASGSPTKKRGVVVRSAAELQWIKDISSNPKTAELAEKMDKVNPPKKESSYKTSTDIFEV